MLTRRVPAVETLGSATVLCVDKTGTLTQNRMSLQKLVANGAAYDLRDHVRGAFPEEFHPVIEFSILASQKNPFDAMEVAFKEFGESYLRDTEHLHPDWQLVREYPLSRRLLSVARVWRRPIRGDLIAAAKGAPETIAELCHLDDSGRKELAARASAIAGEGLRVLGVARARVGNRPLPDAQDRFDFEFLGLVGLADPIRPAVPAAIRECYAAGIRVVMITGDYPVTAQSIATNVGLVPRDQVITGPELDGITDAELREK